ncbi:MAG TPA: hypothetical protein VEB21_01840, partial [Terriglobales bacterium]|nr:hypothetical protein [Terriglobales bacterium]
VELPPRPRAQPAPPAVAPQPKAAVPPPVEIPESRIVPMPDAGVEKAKEDARYLSDRDNTVEQQTVKRGRNIDNVRGEPQAPPAPDQPAQAKPPPAPAPRAARDRPAARAQGSGSPSRRSEDVAALPKLDQLLPRAGDLAMADRAVTGAATQRQTAPAADTRRNLLKGRPDAISSRPGVAAYLPTVKEGDITLLNTKASQFAPFVRRVAARVFQHLEIALRQTASSTIAGSGREYAEVEAVMSPSGERITAILRSRKSETQLAAHRVLLSSANADVFFDRNPPPAAIAADGNIHFLLAIDLHVDIGVDPETGRRGTSYYGVAGVGLE